MPSNPDPATPFWSGQDQAICALVLCRDTGAQDNFIARQAALFSPQALPTISIQPLKPFVLLTGTISKMETEEKIYNHFLRVIIVDYGLKGEGRENIGSTGGHKSCKLSNSVCQMMVAVCSGPCVAEDGFSALRKL